VISGFRREVDETCALVRFYAAYRCNFFPTFRDNLSVPSSVVKKYYRYRPHSNPEERSSHM